MFPQFILLWMILDFQEWENVTNYHTSKMHILKTEWVESVYVNLKSKKVTERIGAVQCIA